MQVLQVSWCWGDANKEISDLFFGLFFRRSNGMPHRVKISSFWAQVSHLNLVCSTSKKNDSYEGLVGFHQATGERSSQATTSCIRFPPETKDEVVNVVCDKSKAPLPKTEVAMSKRRFKAMT